MTETVTPAVVRYLGGESGHRSFFGGTHSRTRIVFLSLFVVAGMVLTPLIGWPGLLTRNFSVEFDGARGAAGASVGGDLQRRGEPADAHGERGPGLPADELRGAWRRTAPGQVSAAAGSAGRGGMTGS
ncbi:MAG: hypothetical protein H7226_02885 [Salinibacterium sp.]|nr:hypothetical protein [Salinibacterium sp.]